jgi:DNA polymerase III epsilon subunit-like protein
MRTYDGLVHSNGNIVCAVDIETTGEIGGYHEIVQIAVVPLDSFFNPRDDIRPFYQNMRPDHLERVVKQAMRVSGLTLDDLILHAPDSGKVADLLREWFESIDLPVGKKLMPLAHNWPFELRHMEAWLGREEFDALFHYRYRDSMQLAQSVNDLASLMGQKLPFNQIGLGYLANKLGVENLAHHDALNDSIVCGRVYAKLLRKLEEVSL